MLQALNRFRRWCHECCSPCWCLAWIGACVVGFSRTFGRCRDHCGCRPRAVADRRNRRALPSVLLTNREAALIVPYRPTDALFFKGRASIAQPRRSHCGIGECLIKTPNSTAVDRHMMQCRPFAGETHLGTNTCSVPAVQAVGVDPNAGPMSCCFLGDDGSDVLR